MSSTVGLPAVLNRSSQSARADPNRSIGPARIASMSPGRRLAAASIAAGVAYFGSGGSSMSSTTRRSGYSCSAADSTVMRMTRSSS